MLIEIPDELGWRLGFHDHDQVDLAVGRHRATASLALLVVHRPGALATQPHAVLQGGRGVIWTTDEGGDLIGQQRIARRAGSVAAPHEESA